jgi:fused signal recognition particle receptor
MDAVLSLLQSPVGIALAVLVAVAVLALVVWGVRRGRVGRDEAPSPRREEESPERPPRAPAESAPAESVTAESVTAESVTAVDEGVPAFPTVAQAGAGAVEAPESVPSRMQRLRARLAGAGTIGATLLGVLSRADLQAADWEEIEDTLLMADLGVPATEQLMSVLRTRVKVEGTRDPQAVRQILAEELLTLVDPAMDRALHLEPAPGGDARVRPTTVLMVGVNGTGKTTTAGKLARVLVAEGKSVLLGAADTFRAAAADQLATWGARVGVDVVRADREGADPASVAFDAVREGAERGIDVVIVDTAGRLQTKTALMDELGKVKRVIEKQAPVSEVLLVLDATTGQNGLRQAEVFAQATDVTGIVLTKLDGSAKGGIVVSVQRELGVPVKLVGLGEGPDDLSPFDPHDFVNAIIGE